jgi:hypothetical protein
MSEKKRDKKPIGERIKGSKFGVFVRDKVKPVAGDILEIAGDITGIQALETVGAFLNGQSHKSDEHGALALEFEKLRLNFELEMTRLDMQTELEYYKTEVSDRDSARVREAAFLNATGKRGRGYRWFTVNGWRRFEPNFYRYSYRKPAARRYDFRECAIYRNFDFCLLRW